MLVLIVIKPSISINVTQDPIRYGEARTSPVMKKKRLDSLCLYSNIDRNITKPGGSYSLEAINMSVVMLNTKRPRPDM